jgi:hypothetical protein
MVPGPPPIPGIDGGNFHIEYAFSIEETFESDYL